jgi:hypothetical protein
MLRRHLVLTSLLLAGCAAQAHRIPETNLADVTVVDRTTGERLPVYWHRGERWIAGAPGHRYSVELVNRTGERLMAVVAVDGVNAVTGETAAWDQNGYVFAPWQRWEVRGWRKSHERIAAFEFTALSNSYAARTGRPDHVGVIGVALFRERPQPRPAPAAPAVRDSSGEPAREQRADAPASESSAAGAAAPQRAEADGQRGRLAQNKSERLGTGHGASEYSYVSTTTFERLRSTPEQVVTIRYDSRENLLALGVIPPAPIAMPTPRPFPGSGGFVPDPPR